MIDLATLAPLFLGGLTVTGLIQWIKGLFPGVSPRVWSASAVVLAAGYALAPPWARTAAGILAISQLGYEVLVQPVRRALEARSAQAAGEKEP